MRRHSSCWEWGTCCSPQVNLLQQGKYEPECHRTWRSMNQSLPLSEQASHHPYWHQCYYCLISVPAVILKRKPLQAYWFVLNLALRTPVRSDLFPVLLDSWWGSRRNCTPHWAGQENLAQRQNCRCPEKVSYWIGSLHLMWGCAGNILDISFDSWTLAPPKSIFKFLYCLYELALRQI